MKKIILFGLLGLLLAACSTDEVDDVNNIVATNANQLHFEGVWSINDVPVEGTCTMYCFLGKTQMEVCFFSFPFEAVIKNNLDKEYFIDSDIETPVDGFRLLVSLVGNSTSNYYYDASPSKIMTFNEKLSYIGNSLLFKVKTQDEETITVTLGLDYNNSIFSLSDAEASCILVVDHVEMEYEDGQKKTLALNPVRKLTFVSTKRLN